MPSWDQVVAQSDKRQQTEPFCVGSGVTQDHNGSYEKRIIENNTLPHRHLRIP